MSNQETIENLWEKKDEINFIENNEARSAVLEILDNLDKGKLRVCEKIDGNWIVNQWLKKTILLSFRIQDMEIISGGPSLVNGTTSWWDKVPSKFQNWGSQDFQNAGFRAVPNCVVRRSAFVAKSAVLMPCFINLGAYVDEGTMIDTWSTVGSCAQVGKNCHISGGAGIGGVLEPLQANPVIIEDNCFVGARAEVAEGVIVREGSVLSMGVYLGASTKIVNRSTGEISYGEVPAYSVVVPGTLPNTDPTKPSLYCVVIVKTVDENTRKKTSINDLLRE